MSQMEPMPKPELTCWDCGAENDPRLGMLALPPP